MSDPTRKLNPTQQADSKAAEDLLPLVYEELRRLAAHKMSNEAAGHTLQPTALVHEAWMRLRGNQATPRFANRAHFFGAAAESMRRILIDGARRKRALRHGAGQARVNIQDVDLPAHEKDEDLLALDEALDKLAAQEPVKAELVKLRYFAGLTIEEAAAALHISEPTAKRYWAYARAWLYREMNPTSVRRQSG